MADEMEQIEARLAAYIDGTLPASQRAEIEAYLQANPAHAKLISELVSLKAALAAFPREKAPADVLDTLQGQIERHALLGEDEDNAPAMRITRWPAFGSAAAVLLLAAGLGLLVYQVLPRPKADLALLSATRPGEVKLSTDGDGPAAKSVEAPAARAKLADADQERKDEPTTGPAFNGGFARAAVPATPAVPPVTAGAQVDATAGERFGLNSNQAELAMQQAPLQNSIANSSLAQNAPAGGDRNSFFSASGRSVPVSDNVRVVVVRSDDPVLTQNLLVGSLVAEKTAFELADWPATLPASAPATTQPGIGDVLKRLHDDQALLDTRAAVNARPLVVRGATGEQTRGLIDTLNTQRPGRQAASYAYGPPPAARARPAAATTEPATQAGAEVGALFAAKTWGGNANGGGGFGGAAAADELISLRATTTPATAPTAVSLTGPAADLVVLVVEQPAATTAPAASRPVTQPTTP